MIEKTVSDVIGEQDKVDVYTAVIEVMNKQIPRSYKMLKTNSGDRLYGCPLCGNVLFPNQKYCDECGQKMEWK